MNSNATPQPLTLEALQAEFDRKLDTLDRKLTEFLRQTEERTIRSLNALREDMIARNKRRKSEIQALDDKLTRALNRIMSALDDLNAPPSTEQSPILRELVERVSDLEDWREATQTRQPR